MFSNVRCMKCYSHLLAKHVSVQFNRTLFLRKSASCKVKQFREFLKPSNDTYLTWFHVNYSTISEFNVEDNTEDEFYSTVDYEKLTKGDENLLKKLKILVLEVDVMRQEGFKVPLKLTTEQWGDLLSLPNKSQRKRHLTFLATKERQKRKDKEKKVEKKQLFEERREAANEEMENNQHIKYGFGGSTIFIRIYETKIDALQNNRLIQAMMFGQNLVIDCGYDEHMNIQESSNCAKQLGIIFSENRKENEPFNLHFCNANPETKVMRRLHKLIPTMYDPGFPMNVTQKSYLDLFPKNKLVYLTPHCKTDLKSFNYDDVYIIGGMVDKVKQDPLSLAKAKQEGLRVARLPLDRYLNWNIGSKSLTINQVLKILLELKTNPTDWNKALTHVPRRKINEEEPPKFYKKRNLMRNSLFKKEYI